MLCNETNVLRQKQNVPFMILFRGTFKDRPLLNEVIVR